MPSHRQVLIAPAVAWLARGAEPPPDFPDDLEICPESYENWDGAITTGPLWTCVPRTSKDVVTAVNWAHRHGYTVRARGYRHCWAPLTVEPRTTAKVLLVDTTRHLTAMSVSGTSVRVQAGASMDSLLTYLERHGLGLTAVPAPGDVSIGGVLAVNGHGTGVPARGERGGGFGTVSNLVVSLTAVVWDGTRYREHTFRRDEPDCAALLTHLGRGFVTEATLRAGPNRNLRCRSYLDIHADELFAAESGHRSLAGLLDRSGRVGVIWFAFTDRPWVQVWDVEPARPLLSRRTRGPYNFPFVDHIPKKVAELGAKIITGAPELATRYGPACRLAVSAGLTATLGWDLWGPSKDIMLFVRPTTARVTAGSYAVLTPRPGVQDVVHRFTTHYQDLLDNYRSRGLFPINGGVEIRVTGLDEPPEPGAVAPALSAARPVPGCDTAVWLDVFTFPGTPGAHDFYRDLEDFVHGSWPGRTRVEWSKRWAHTGRGAWTDPVVLGERIPATFPDWDKTVATLDSYDPHRVFTAPLLDVLLR